MAHVGGDSQALKTEVVTHLIVAANQELFGDGQGAGLLALGIEAVDEGIDAAIDFAFSGDDELAGTGHDDAFGVNCARFKGHALLVGEAGDVKECNVLFVQATIGAKVNGHRVEARVSAIVGDEVIDVTLPVIGDARKAANFCAGEGVTGFKGDKAQ